MLFMDVITWEPEKRNEVIRRAAEWKCPDGLNERGYWVGLSGRQAFYLYEADDPKVVMEANSFWTDIVKIDSFQVMDIEDAMKLMQGK